MYGSKNTATYTGCSLQLNARAIKKNRRDVLSIDSGLSVVKIGSSKHVERDSLKGNSERSAPLIIN